MRKHLLVLLVFSLLAVALTWPMAQHFATHVPGDGIDDPSLAWNLWWVKHSLVDAPANPFACDYQFWPVGINLAFYTLTILNGLLSVPLQGVFGLIPAYNLLLWSSFVLGGFGAYLLSLDLLGVRRRRDPSPASRSGESRGADSPGVTDAGRRGDRSDGPRLGAGVPNVGRASAVVRSLGPCSRVARRQRTPTRGYATPGFGTAGLGGSGRSWSAGTTFAAALAGAFYAFASAKLFYASLGQGNIASSQWIPFAALYLLRALQPEGRPRDAVLAALFVLLQAYAELTFASFLAIFAGLVLAWQLPVRFGPARGRALQAGPRARALAGLAGRLALIAALCAAGIAPFLANMLPDLAAEGDFFTSGGGFADVFSADLAGYAVPTQLHPLLGGIVRGWSQASGGRFAVDKGQQIYLGYAALALAGLGLWRGRRGREAWFWAAAAVLFFLLTLGPSLRAAGRDLGVPLPFRLVEQLPFFKGNRYPSRYSVMLLLCTAPLLALGAQALATSAPARLSLRRGTGRESRGTKQRAGPAASFGAQGALVLLSGLLLFEHLSAPLPLFDLRVPALYDRVAAEPGDVALLELPLGWRNGARVAGKKDIVIMQQLWYQSRHEKRLLGGNTSRNPEFKFQYFSEDPTLARLIALVNAADTPQHDALRADLAGRPVTDQERARAIRWASTLGIRYVMVHRDKLPAEAEAVLLALLPASLLAEEGPLALYRVAEAPAAAGAFEAGQEADRMILAEGWSPPASGAATGEPAPVYAQRREARLLLPIAPGGARIRLRLQALAEDQQVTLVVGGGAVGSAALPEEPVWLAFDAPANPERPPMSDVRLRFSRVAPIAYWAAAASGSRPAGLLVRSAGEETGDFAHIYVDGVERSPNGRGYNLVALERDSGRVLAAAGFDTHADPEASAALAAWLAQWPAGTIFAGAVRDEASLRLSAEAAAALGGLGLGADLRGRFRWSHAFIATAGGREGPLREASSGMSVAQVSLGLPLSAPEAAAALYAVELLP